MDNANTPLVEVQDISFVIGTHYILDKVSFDLTKGETLAVVGPSGSGKTSLLYMLNRLQDPWPGKIIFNGKNLKEYSVIELRRRIGMVMQQPVLFDGTVRENIVYGPALRGSAGSVNLKTLLEYAGLPIAFLDKAAGTLSGGEKQRVAFARTLANEPEVLLLDEPTSALDQGTTEVIEQTVDLLRRVNEMSTIWITHSPEQAQRISERALLLEGGKVTACGPTGEVLQKKTGLGRELAEKPIRREGLQ